MLTKAFENAQKAMDELQQAAKIGPYALSNIGYYSGYYSRESADRIMEVFKTAHPIFGRCSYTCLNNAYHGCPYPMPDPDPALIKERRAEKWRVCKP